jgi:predicted ATPase
VITGAPCSGKTTVISELEKRGFAVVHEAARALIESQLLAGRTLEQIRGDDLRFQQDILLLKLENEKRLSDTHPVFLDRGLPDSIAYYRLSGLDIGEPLARCREVRYNKVFFFERLALSTDSVRNEDEETARRLDRLIAHAYEMLDYNLIYVPVLPFRERTEFVLNNLGSD